MKAGKKSYSIFQTVSVIFMILSLLWLTVSAPFVLASQQEMAKQEKSTNAQSPLSGTEEETNPFGNNTEEKAPSSSSFSEEYLHDHLVTHYFLSEISQEYKCVKADTYHAFHGELLVPPPNAV